jgi:thiazole/oxazole-forming peptide maturase SagD family component
MTSLTGSLLPTVTFDAALEGASNLALRRQLVRTAPVTPYTRIHVTTLFHRPPDVHADGPVTWMLLDYHRAFLYSEPANPRETGIESVVQVLIEDYSPALRRAIKYHLEEFGYKCLYDPALFGFVLRSSSDLRSGELLAFDFLSGETRKSRPRPHPDITRKAPQTAGECCPPVSFLDFAISFTNSSLRGAEPVHCDRWISQDTGVVREERLRLWSNPVPSAVARAASPTPSQAGIVGGKSLRAQTALHIAHCEALERFQLMYPGPDESLVYGSYSSLRAYAINPGPLFMGVPGRDEYKQQAWTESSEFYWSWAHQPSSGACRLVPAQSIWFTSRFEGEHIYAANSTSGCALGSCNTEAAIFALLEIIERDAYLVMWYLRRCCRKIAPSSLRSTQFQTLWEKARLEFPSYNFHLLDLRCDLLIPAVAVVATRERGRGVRSVHAAAARLSAEQAASKALQDVLIELANSQRQSPFVPPPRGSNPSGSSIRGPEDHRALYYLDASFEFLSFFPFESSPQVDAMEIDLANPVRCGDECELRHILDKLVSHLGDIGIYPWFKDITHSFCASEGVCCMRAIAPGMFPLWFGQHPQVDLTPRLRNLAVTLTGRSLSSIEELNLEPHPFS